ncbi:MAG: hypothetical protein Q8L20_11105 [Gammaproteobacteria bacterium]|nr:hypothetical protein [Gammaproteobacteria bacterium]
MTLGKFIVCTIGVVLASIYFVTAYVGAKHQEATVRIAELAVEAARIELRHLELWGELCVTYEAWKHHQQYIGKDLMNGKCDDVISAQESNQ